MKNDTGRSEAGIAREHLIRARLYSAVAMVFVAVGFVIFFIFYERYIDGDASAFFRKPVLFAIMFLPFLPAYIFALLATRQRKAAAQVIYGRNAETQGKSGKGDGVAKKS